MDVTTGSGWNSVKSVSYSKDAWSITVGFSDAGRAEELVFSKPNPLPQLPLAKLNPAEQQALLDRFKEGSTWSLDKEASVGPQWERADKKAYASYITEYRWFVIMDFPCLERKFKSMPGNKDRELAPP